MPADPTDSQPVHAEVQDLVQPHLDDEAVLDLADDTRYERALGVLAQLTDELLDTIKAMDDEAVRQPSLLPGWSRGHVLTHVARNADGLGNLVTWARTGVETPAYPSREARDADIESGSARSASELESDVESSAERLLASIAALPVDRRHVAVRSGGGSAAPAHDVLWWRIREVAYHHVDLGLAYGFGHLPPAVLRRGLDEAVERLAAAGAPALALHATDLGWTGATRPDGAAQDVRGTAADVLGWLTGRTSGAGLTSASALPPLPSWG